MQLIADRRALHRIPELDRNLPKTMAYLQQALQGLPCKVFAPMENSLCAWFDFGRDSAIAFRADCDALAVTEATGADYASCHPGKMHACGHDGHMAILLELARRLSTKKALGHNVLLIFQPAEENVGGAEEICGTGVLRSFGVQAVFGLHLWPGIEAGIIHSRVGELMSRSSELNVDIYGKSAHIAKASEGVDAVAAGAEFYRRAMQMEKALPPQVYRLLKFGVFHSGTVRNALSAHTRLEGSLRAFQDEVFEELRSGLYEIAAQVEAEFNCRVEIRMSQGYPAVINPAELAARVCQVVPVKMLDAPSMTSEDFSFYQRNVGGMFFFLGLGDVPALHTADFNFDETLLSKGADFFETLAEGFV